MAATTIIPRGRWHQETEAGFLAAVKQLARVHGWRVYHTLWSQGSDAGFPDLTLVRGPDLIFAELKRRDGVLTGPQTDWLHALRGVEHVEACVWRPANWAQLEATLALRRA